MIEYVTYEHFLEELGAGYQGSTIERRIEGLLAADNPEPEYTVYWPKDSIRVIPGSSYEVARTVVAILKDGRTRYMGAPTNTAAAEISLVRREIYQPEWASDDQVNNGTVFAEDRLLPWDISVSLPFHVTEQADPGVTYRLDLSTLPDL